MKFIGASSFLLLAPMLSLKATALLFHTSPNASSINTTGLSIPNCVPKQVQLARAAETQALASQIVNEKRTWRISGVEYPTYDGPVPRPGSLYEKLQTDESLEMLQFDKNKSAALFALALNSPFDMLADYDAFYANAASLTTKPVSVDISDENFGYQRTTFKGFNLRAFKMGTDTFPSDPKFFVTGNIAKICGSKRTSLESIAKGNDLYVSDFSDLGKWSDPSKVGVKFVASVVGFFCYNEDRRKLLPFAIRIVDSNLTYTPFDKQEEWTLAKMALDTAEVSYQQESHLADSHAVSIPMRIETFRHLPQKHPVSALLLRTNHIDFGLEKRATAGLFNESTLMDKTFGFGAAGALQFVGYQLQFTSIENDFEADIKNRGLQHLPIHKYAKYGKFYRDAFEKMVGAYLEVYYPSDKAVADDFELQDWAKGCASVTQLRGFPTEFTSARSLQKVLTYLIFQSTVRHHAMNGANTWETMAVPYSNPALWKKLPTKKLEANEILNVLEYSPPKAALLMQVVLAAQFFRQVPESESIVSIFNASPFTGEGSKLKKVASGYESSLKAIDQLILFLEKDEKHPYLLLRPSMLARYGWV